MINEHLLQKFCAGPDFGNGSITAPFSQDKFTFATNGHIIVRMPRMAAVPESCKAPCPMNLPWDHEQLTAWHPMPDYTLPLKVLCPACEGTQYVAYCEKCDDLRPAGKRCPRCKGRLWPERDICELCDWQGRADVSFRVSVNAAQVNGHYLELIKSLPGPWWFALDPKEPQTGTIRFKFEGGVGLLMPMLPNEGRIS